MARARSGSVLQRVHLDQRQSEWTAKERAQGANLWAAISRELNIMGGTGVRDGLIEAFLKEHNTLQQQAVQLFLECLYAFDEQVNGNGQKIDLRNEAAADRARKVVEALGDYGYSVPLI